MNNAIVKKHLDNGQYLTSEFEKFFLFYHHTAGLSAMSAWRWWNSTPERVGTAYIIERDGVIYECFDPKAWAYHLGISADNHYIHKHSIAVELVSAGHLYLENKQFRFYPLWPNKQRYNVIPEEDVHIFSEPWGGHKYYHKYSDSQLESVKWLNGRLALDFPKLRFSNSIQEIFEYNSEVIKEKIPGLWAHCTVRKDKNDIFPYPPLIEALEDVQKEIKEIEKPTQIEEVKVKAKGRKNKKSSKSGT